MRIKLIGPNGAPVLEYESGTVPHVGEHIHVSGKALHISVVRKVTHVIQTCYPGHHAHTVVMIERVPEA